MAFLDDQSLQIIISAKDEATKVIKGLEGTIKDMGPVFSGMQRAGTAALVGIAGAVGVGIKAFGEAERSQRQLEHAILDISKGSREQIDVITKLSETLQKKVGIDGDALKMGAAQLSTFGLQSESVVNLTKSLADLTVNQNGVNATSEQYVESANVMAKALRGQFGVLERSGIRFTEAQQNIILYGTETEKVAALQEGLAQNLRETTDTLTGVDVGIASATRALGEISEAIGATFAPMLGELSAKISPILNNIAEWIAANPELVKQITITAAAVAGLLVVVGTLGLALPAIAAGFAILASPVTLIVLALTGLAAAAIIFRDRLTEIIDYIDQKTGLITLFQWAWDNIVTTFNDTLLPALMQLWEALKPLEPLLSLIGKVIAGVLLGAVYGITLAITGWVQIITAIIAAAAEFSAAIINYFVKPIESFIDVVKKAVEWVSKLISKMGDIGVKNLGKKAISGISNILGFEHGGLINAPRGTAVPIIAHGQERIIPAGHAAGATGGGNFSVVINNPQVRSNDDVREMRRQMEAAWRDVTRGHKLNTI